MFVVQQQRTWASKSVCQFLAALGKSSALRSGHGFKELISTGAVRRKEKNCNIKCSGFNRNTAEAAQVELTEVGDVDDFWRNIWVSFYIDGQVVFFAMEFILESSWNFTRGSGRGRFAGRVFSRKLTEALQVKQSFLQMQKRHIGNQIIRCVENS